MSNKSRSLENKTRMTISGYRCRVGNPKHPFYNLYKEEGFDAVFLAMGLIENTASKIRKEVLSLYDEYVEGYVYVISNPAWPDWVKIGMAIDADDRCNAYQTSSPYRDYVLHCAVATDDRRKDESKAHKALEKISDSRRGEWFNMPVEKAVECITGLLK